MSAFTNAALVMDPITPSAPTPGVTWDRVVDEIVWSCAGRAIAGTLLQRPGVVGVLAGAAPVVWVYGDASSADLLEILDAAPAVNDVYVTADAPGLISRIADDGWQLGERVDQYAHRTGGLVDVTDTAIGIRPIGPADLDSWRLALIRWGGLAPALALAAYPDDFFEVARPVEVLAAYDDDGAFVGSVGRRDQQRSAMLFGLAVAPDWRHRGVASALVRTAMGRAGRDGADFVHAQAGLAGAAVFDRCGFTALGGWQQLTRRRSGD